MPYPTRDEAYARGVRNVLRALGYEPKHDGSARDFLQDNAFHCTECEGFFSSRNDMADEEDQPEFGNFCFFCRWGHEAPGRGASRTHLRSASNGRTVSEPSEQERAA